MSHQNKVRSRDKARHNSAQLRIGIAVLAALAFAGVWAMLPPAQDSFTPTLWQQALGFGKRQLGFPSTPEHPYIFPYSVAPGGIHSLAQLERAIARDPVDAREYANFNLSKFRKITLKKCEYAYVAYRIGDDVFWTKKKLALCQGESLITDGTHYLRARCGNPISEGPQAETWNAPPPDALPDGGSSSPVQTEAFAAVNPDAGQPVTSLLVPGPSAFPTPTAAFTPIPPGDFVPPVFGVVPPPPVTPASHHNTPAPEDGTLLLIVTGMAALALGWQRRKAAAVAPGK
jgi:hypothetical protein